MSTGKIYMQRGGSPICLALRLTIIPPVGPAGWSTLMHPGLPKGPTPLC